MSEINWKKFKSGTDIRGVASEGVEGEHVNLTDEAVAMMAKGFVAHLSELTGVKPEDLKIAVGHDSRISGERIKNAVIGAMTKAGVKVYDCGLSSTPAMFMTTIDLNVDGSVQITASHHPFNRNGLKFFTKKGGFESEDISTVLELCAENIDLPEKSGSVEKVNYMIDYAKRLREMIKKGVNAENYEKPLEGFKIVVDAGNGAGGFYAFDVLEPLGADVNGSCFLEPDGMFPNHIPNPENEEAMKSVCNATLSAKADLGVIFDTDVDRGGAVDCNGQEINRNRLVALASAIALEGNEGGTIVTDSITSTGLKTFIEKDLGGVHYRYRRGYRNVINEALRLNGEGVNAPLAIETSGHAALRENYFLDDGAYLVTKIIIKMAQLRSEGSSLSQLTANLAEAVEEKELRFKIREENFREFGEKLLSELETYAESAEGWKVADDNREGVRVYFDKDNGDGWFLLRLSVHDPIMPLNIESDSEGGVLKIAVQICEFLKNYKEKLDISPIESFIG